MFQIRKCLKRKLSFLKSTQWKGLCCCFKVYKNEYLRNILLTLNLLFKQIWSYLQNFLLRWPTKVSFFLFLEKKLVKICACKPYTLKAFFLILLSDVNNVTKWKKVKDPFHSGQNSCWGILLFTKEALAQMIRHLLTVLQFLWSDVKKRLPLSALNWKFIKYDRKKQKSTALETKLANFTFEALFIYCLN